MPRSRLNMPKSLESGRNNQVLLYAQEAHVGLSVLAACMASSRPAPESTSRLTFAAGDGRSIAWGCATYIGDRILAGASPFIDEGRDESGPAGLMRSAQPLSGLGVEVLMEEDEIAPVGVLLEFPAITVGWPPPRGVTGEDADQTVRQIVGHLPKGYWWPGPPVRGHHETRAERVTQCAQ